MNDLIRQLAEQAKRNEPFECSYTKEQWLEKFAELIVRECASLFPLTFTDEQYQRRIDKTINKHFGVE